MNWQTKLAKIDIFIKSLNPCLWFNSPFILVLLNSDYLMYLFQRESTSMSREKGRGKGRSRLPTEQGARHGAQSQDPRIPGSQDHDLSWRQSLNWLSHPGAPYCNTLNSAFLLPLPDDVKPHSIPHDRLSTTDIVSKKVKTDQPVSWTVETYFTFVVAPVNEISRET